MWFSAPRKLKLPDAAHALPGRSDPIQVASRHFVLGSSMVPPFPEGMRVATVGMGCFWGAERKFWETPGVYSTMVGYAAGVTPNPTYREVCSGQTGHSEVVQIVFDPAKLSYENLLQIFWEGHDPTQGMRQGADIGTQYRSLIMFAAEGQRETAEASMATYQQMLSSAGHGTITTELADLDDAHPFYYAEDYHQQYLAKNPGGYCGHGGTGVSCPIGLAVN